jgi:hypothetical protein
VTRILTAFERGGDQFVAGASSQAAGEPVVGHVRACALSSRVERLERIGKWIKIGLVRVCGVFGLGFSVDSVHTSIHHGARRGFRTASASF